ncbi:UNVERIFIED_CONTAM: putative lysophospholipase BODYGUARD 3 [Sesamum radiatum]|uniref:Lysophospholipase BODYGUARD 3 n=1 Tax=Sesamum radiatum TaxID=300843 RepID=A0AAW2MG72_SESRA
MAVKKHVVSVLTMAGGLLHEILSFIVFTMLDLLDFVLCYAFKVADVIMEAERKPCYCSSGKEAITSSGKILVSEQGESKVVSLNCSKLQLEEISDTLYARPSWVSKVWKCSFLQSSKRISRRGAGPVRPTFTVNPTIVEMLQGRIGRQQMFPVPRWSDCDCKTCTSWTSSSCKETLFVKADGAKGKDKNTDICVFVLLHCKERCVVHYGSYHPQHSGLYPNFSKSAKSKYRLLAVDLLGFGRSPKPADSLYTLREHLEMIERSVLETYNVKSFHIVAHSLGCILALALAVKHPGSIKSLTLLAPPYFPAPKGEASAQHMMRRIAPRRLWPIIAFGASIACWYEHITRAFCLVMCRNHRLWESITRLLTGNRCLYFF